MIEFNKKHLWVFLFKGLSLKLAEKPDHEFLSLISSLGLLINSLEGYETFLEDCTNKAAEGSIITTIDILDAGVISLTYNATLQETVVAALNYPQNENLKLKILTFIGNSHEL